jgi:hypothetical protein
MPTDLRPFWTAPAALVISLGGIAGGAGRISTSVQNTTAAAGAAGDEAELLRIYAKIMSGTAPAANAPYLFYLIRRDWSAASEYVTEGLGLVDAAVATQPNNSEIIGSIPTRAAGNTDHYLDVVVPNPGPAFSVVFWNGSSQSLHATGGNHYIRYSLGSMRVIET